MASTIRGNDNFDSAGPFGASTLISDSVSVGTGATFSVSFSGNYRAYRLLLNGINTNTNFQNLYWRYTDASGTAITSQAYAWRYSNKVTDTSGLATYMGIQEYYHQIYNVDRAYIDMHIYNPNSATEVTWASGFHSFTSDSNYQGNFTSQVSAHTYGISANSSIYFYNHNSGNFSGGTYSLWGLN